MIATKVFKSGNSQAVRIPAELRTDKSDFYIARLGEGYIVYPADDPWYPSRAALIATDPALVPEREQPLWDDVPGRNAL